MRRPLEDVRQLDRISEEFTSAVARRLRDFIARGGFYQKRYGSAGLGMHGVRISDIRRVMLPVIEHLARKSVRRMLDAEENRRLFVFGLGEPMERDLVREVMANYSRSLYYLERDMAQRLGKLLRRAAYEGWDYEKLEREMKREIGRIAESRIKVIARTEMQNIYLKIRERIGERFERRTGRKVLYRWVTAGDGRVCPVCREIERRTRRGVTLEELKTIIRDVVTRYGLQYNPTRPFTPHPNDRCTFVPVGFR